MPVVQVIFHPLATKEYVATLRWYARRSPRAAQDLKDEVERGVREIANDPHRWPVHFTHYHWFGTRRFPFLLVYRFLDATRVVLVAVAHTGRRPGYWRRRFRP